MFAAILVCSFNDASKILRKEVATCPVAAARAIAHGLHKDSGLLLSRYYLGILTDSLVDNILQANTTSAISCSVNKVVLLATAASSCTSGNVR